MTNDLTGTTIADRYVLGSLRGATGELAVYDADDGVVVELVPSDSLEAAELAQVWPATASLSHPNVVAVLASGVTDIDGVRYLYRATERPEETVAEVLPTRALAGDEARQVLEAVVPALSYLHSHGFVHRSIHPESIAAVRNNVKLTIQPVRPGGQDAAAQDVLDLGATIVQILTGNRPETRTAAAAAGLPVPFGPIAAGILGHGWTLDMVRRALAGQSVAFPAPVRATPDAVRESPSARPPVSGVPPKWLMAGAGVLVAILLVFALARPSKQPPAPVPVAEQPRPSPVTARNPAAPPPETPAPSRERSGGYAVIAATYRNQAAAEKRAASIRKRWTRTEVTVAGTGRHYVVVLGRGLSRQDAERIQKQARAAGLPRDTHVTRF